MIQSRNDRLERAFRCKSPVHVAQAVSTRNLSSEMNVHRRPPTGHGRPAVESEMQDREKPHHPGGTYKGCPPKTQSRSCCNIRSFHAPIEVLAEHSHSCRVERRTHFSFLLPKSEKKRLFLSVLRLEQRLYFPSFVVSAVFVGTFDGDLPAFVVQEASRAKLSSPSTSFNKQRLLSTNSTSSPAGMAFCALTNPRSLFVSRTNSHRISSRPGRMKVSDS